MKGRSARSWHVTCLLAACATSSLSQGQLDAATRGIQALQAQDYAAAREIFASEAKSHPSAHNYGYLAMAEAGTADLKSAIGHFREALRLGGANVTFEYNLGVAYVEDHQTNAGIEEFRGLLRRDPKNNAVRYALGLALLDAHSPTLAAEQLAYASRQAPEDLAIRANLVKAKFEAGYDKQAEADIKQALDANHENPRLAVALATICLERHKIQVARNLLEGANEIMPNDEDIALLLVKTSLLAGEPVEALAVLKGLPAERQATSASLVMAGYAKALTNDLSGAESDLIRAVQEEPDNIEALQTYAWVEQQAEHQEKAIALLEQAERLAPQSATIAYRMAVSYYLRGNYSKAQTMCERTATLSPAFSDSYWLRGVIAVKQRDYQGAIKQLEHAIRVDAHEAIYHRELGVALMKAGQPLAALNQANAALRLDPKDAETYLLKARISLVQGAKTAAIGELKTALDLKPNSSEISSELSRLYASVGRAQEASTVLADQQQLARPALDGDQEMLRNRLTGAPQ